MKSVLKLFSGEVVVLISRMLLVLYVAHSYGTESVGLYTTLMTWASIISLAAVFGGYNIIQKRASDTSAISVVLFLLCMVSTLSSLFISLFIYREFFLFSVFVLLSESIGLGVKSVSKAISYCDGKLNELALLNYFNSFSYVLSCIFLLMVDNSLIGLSIFVVIYNAMTVVVYFYPIYMYRDIKTFNINDIVRYVQSAYPYFISSFLRNSFSQLDKIIVNLLFGNQVSGLYNMCSRFLNTAMLPVSIYIQSIESKFYHFEKDNQGGFSFLVSYRNKVLWVSVFLSLISFPIVWFLSSSINGLNGVADIYPYFMPMGVITNVAYLYLSYLNAGRTILRIASLALLNIFVVVIISALFYFSEDKYIYLPVAISFVILSVLVYVHEKIK
ncbi:lipopolysaccharide biosynthesis protein [Aeromonas veronii]|uniref:lipopolysaccharide biosynthesis protein n=1 Tax=Aeromonas veronii TaxID=654 RepID=UPI002B493BFF|nr:oligosaccharide flippase family protein [Aeromonas veronii]